MPQRKYKRDIQEIPPMMVTLTLSIGETVMLARKRHGWSMRALAKNAGVSLPTVLSIEEDKGSVKFLTLQKVLDALGVQLQLDVKKDEEG